MRLGVPDGRVSAWTAEASGSLATASTSPGFGPNPARHSRRSAWRRVSVCAGGSVGGSCFDGAGGWGAGGWGNEIGFGSGFAGVTATGLGTTWLAGALTT